VFQRYRSPVKSVGQEKHRIGGQQERGENGCGTAYGTSSQTIEKTNGYGSGQHHGQAQRPHVRAKNRKNEPKQGGLESPQVGHQHERHRVMEDGDLHLVGDRRVQGCGEECLVVLNSCQGDKCKRQKEEEAGSDPNRKSRLDTGDNIQAGMVLRMRNFALHATVYFSRGLQTCGREERDGALVHQTSLEHRGEPESEKIARRKRCRVMLWRANTDKPTMAG
jgi:hypothetical protein